MKKVQLLTTHEHRGVVHAAGSVLEVADADAEFITARQLGVLLEVEKADEYNKSNGKSKGKPTESAVEKNEEQVNDDSAITDPSEEQPNKQQGEA